MLRLEDLRTNAAIAGIEPHQIVRVIAVESVSTEVRTVGYEAGDDQLGERMVCLADEAVLLKRTEASCPI